LIGIAFVFNQLATSFVGVDLGVPKKSKPAKRQSRDAKALRQDLQDSPDKLHPEPPAHPIKNPAG